VNSLRKSALLLVATLTTALWAAPASADHSRSPKLDLALRQKVAHGKRSPERVIITVRSGMRPLLREALGKHGDQLIAEHPSIEALTAVVHGEDLEALANDPAVVAVSYDAPVTVSGRGKREIPDRALKYYGTLRAQLGLTGSDRKGEGIGVAVIDSGIDPNEDLSSNIRAFYDFTGSGIRWTRPYDDFGHGTHVAGLIAGTGVNSEYSYMGVAPSARLIGLKVLDAEGRGTTSDVLRALDFAIANRVRFGIDIINLSLGHPIYEPAETDPLVASIERATRMGIVVVVAAGNFGQNNDGAVGYAGILSPGNAPNAITVGAADTRGTVERWDDVVEDYSSRGPTWYDGYIKPDVVAPGHRLVSSTSTRGALYKDLPANRVRGKGRRYDYLSMSGTSMAAAVVSGSVALVLEASRGASSDAPALTANAVKAILQYTAVPLCPSGADPGETADGCGEVYDALTQGTGSINVGGATLIASLIDTTMPGMSRWVPYAPSPYTTIAGDTYAWAQNIVWGGRKIVDTDALWSNSLAWADNVVWGSALDADDNIVWGTLARYDDNIVWGTFARAWGDNIVWGTGLLSTVNGDNIVWGSVRGDNIVWGTLDDDNIVWGTRDKDNIVWGTRDGDDNIVWGTRQGQNGNNGTNGANGNNTNNNNDNIVWGTRKPHRTQDPR
jgi:serine protease AprX